MTASSVTYLLEHFYYGQVVRNGTPEGDLQLLAESKGITPEQIAESVKLGLIPPVPDSPTGSWALIRGRNAVQFMLVQSMLGEMGQSMLHYILCPVDTLRGMGGNLRALLKLVQEKMPIYDQPGGPLAPLAFSQPEFPTVEEQIDEILDLMSVAHNRMDTLETMLAAIVQGVPLVVQNAPLDVTARIGLVQGLLALLPQSARFGVTYATHTLASTQTEAQVRFHSGGKLSRETLVYDWPTGKLAGKAIEDDYSRFIISQLRLDAELVSKQTRRLTAVAAWRIRRGEGLAEALAYGARRMRLDDALLGNQPVETADISKVLGEDPTLSDDLKIAYTRHLLAFALALGDVQHADPIAVMIRQQPDLERALQEQFKEAIPTGKAGIVFDAISRWLATPLGPVGKEWVELAHRAALAHMDGLVTARDLPGISTFLEGIQKANPGIEINKVVPKLIEMALPLSIQNRDLNTTVFLLAVNHTDADILRKLIGAQRFIAGLPPAVGRIAPYLTGQDAGLAPSGLLMDTAGAFGDEWRDLLLIRLCEIAVRARRPDIIDVNALVGLMSLLRTAWGAQYGQTLGLIAKQMSTDEVLSRLESPGPTYLLQILLASGAYADLASELLHQSRLLYPADRQGEYVHMVRRVFTETPLATVDVQTALRVVSESGVRALPLTMAYIGALEGHDWSSDLDPVAEEATSLLFDNPGILKVIPPIAMIALLKFHITRGDIAKMVRVAGLLPDVAVREGSKGINLIGRMYKLMESNDERVQLARLELLRRYVRHAQDEDGRRAVTAFGREFGLRTQQVLEATYALKRLMGGMDMVGFADFLHITISLLQETAQVYVDKNQLPTVGALRSDLDSMSGGLNDEGRRTLAAEMVGLGKALVVVGDQAQAARTRDPERTIQTLLDGEGEPASVLEIFWIMGGYFTKGKRFALKLERPTSAHPFGPRSAPMLRDEVQIANTLLRSAIRAFPPDKKMTIAAEFIRAEMDSLWGEVPLAKQREIVRDLATDLQSLPQLGLHIIGEGGDKAMEDSPLARKLEQNSQQPKSTLELYRFVAGYFKSRSGNS
jgi:hypothetical protein